MIFDYVNAKGENVIKIWSEGLEKDQRAKLNQKLDMLEIHGHELPPGLLSDCGTPGIKKLKIKGNVQLRPLLCEGPVDTQSEYTMLIGAIEKAWKWVPRGAPDTANSRKQEIIVDPKNRRIKHERVS